MGNGGFLPDGLQGRLVIVPALDKMFGADLQDTKTKFRLLKQNFFQKLGDHDDADTDKGVGRRQRTLRHVAWILTADVFDRPEYTYPNTRFQLWLRYLTWIEHVVTNYKVTVNGQPSNLKPAAAIKKTIVLALQNNTKIKFDWKPAPGPYELNVDVVQNTAPMTITLMSIKGEDIPATVLSDEDDILRKP